MSTATAPSSQPVTLPDATPQDTPFTREGEDWVATFRADARLDLDLVHTLRHQSVVCCVRFSPDGTYVATGCNRTAQIFNVSTGERVCVLEHTSVLEDGHGDVYIRAVSFSPDGRFLVTGAEENLRIWSLPTGALHATLEGHTQEVYSLEYSPDGRFIASGSGDKTVRVWGIDSQSGNASGQVTILAISEPNDTVERGIASVAISPDSRFVAAASLDHSIYVWDVASGALAARLVGHGDMVYSVVFTRDGTGLVSGSLDKTAKRWDVTPLWQDSLQQRTWECTHTYTGHSDYVLCVALSQDPGTSPQWVISAAKDRCVRFWDMNTSTTVFTVKGHRNSVIAVDASPAGGVFATGSGDWDAKIWRFTSQP